MKARPAAASSTIAANTVRRNLNMRGSFQALCTARTPIAAVQITDRDEKSRGQAGFRDFSSMLSLRGAQRRSNPGLTRLHPLGIALLAMTPMARATDPATPAVRD